MTTTPGTPETAVTADFGNPELGPVTTRSALTASSMLLVVDLDSDAPNTAMADTKANPTMRAAAV